MHRNILYALMILTPLAFAGSVTQSNWLLGPYIPGPVVNWALRFDSEVNITWNQYGYLRLDSLFNINVEEDLFYGFYVCASDIDGDGDGDIISCWNRTLQIGWWENLTGNGLEWKHHLIQAPYANATCLEPSDVDSDGDIDVFGAMSNAYDVVWWENLDGLGDNWLKHVIDDNFEVVHWIRSGDLDGDNDCDVICSGYNTIAWYEKMDYSGLVWTKHTLTSTLNGAYSVELSDLDNDGDLDVINSSYAQDLVLWWENLDGLGGTWAQHEIDTTLDGPWSVLPVDIDNDSDNDVLCSGHNANEIVWFENVDGAGSTWSRRLIGDEFYGGMVVSASDFDSDGDMDVACCSYSSNELAWWENIDGVGGAWDKHVLSTIQYQAYCTQTGDVDSDGSNELLSSALGILLTKRVAITWWDIDRTPRNGVLLSSIIDLNAHPNWAYFDWTEEIPPATDISFLVRCSDNFVNMGEWSDTLYSPGDLVGIIEEGDDFFQYMLIMQRDESSSVSPILHDVTLDWDTLCCPGSPEQGLELLGPIQNPSTSPVSIAFNVPELCSVQLRVYDITGRVVEQLCSDFTAGHHEVTILIENLGVYFAYMSAGEYSTTQRFIILE